MWNNGILFTKLLQPKKIVIVIEKKLLKLEAEGRIFAKILRSPSSTLYSNSEKLEQYLNFSLTLSGIFTCLWEIRFCQLIFFSKISKTLLEVKSEIKMDLEKKITQPILGIEEKTNLPKWHEIDVNHELTLGVKTGKNWGIARIKSQYIQDNLLWKM